eukprot:sb/3469847/
MEWEREITGLQCAQIGSVPGAVGIACFVCGEGLGVGGSNTARDRTRCLCHQVGAATDRLHNLYIVLIIVIVTVVATSNGEKPVYNSAEWENGRLNATVYPVHYNIWLGIDVDGKKFSGHEEIQLEFGGHADGTVAQIVLHADEGLTVTNPKFWKTYNDREKNKIEFHDIQKMITWSQNSYVIIQFNSVYQYTFPDFKLFGDEYIPCEAISILILVMMIN